VLQAVGFIGLYLDVSVLIRILKLLVHILIIVILVIILMTKCSSLE